MEENNLTTYEKAVLRDKEARQLLHEAKTLGKKMRFSYNPKLTPLFYPGTKALIVDIHGGGFCFKSVLDNDVYCDYISKKYNVAVLNADFTLSYEAPYPQQIVDISAELVSLLEKENALVAVPLFFVGHSSGATLAAACAIRLHNDMRISGCLLNYPFLDLAMDQSKRPVMPNTFPDFLLNDWISMYCPYKELLNRTDVSPLALSSESIIGFPPSVITVAKQDRLQDDGRRFASLLEEAHIPHLLLEVDERHGFIERHMCHVNDTPEDPAVIQAKKTTDESFDWLLKYLAF
jgi:acetyl esterase/lipase